MSAEFWKSDLLGQLRFDSLISRTIVVPDSHLFDGVFFAAVSPERLLMELGRCGPDDDPSKSATLPIEWRARRPTLSESLAELLRRDGSPNLNHYVFKTIDDRELREQIATALADTPSERLNAALASKPNAAEAVTSVLGDCLNALGMRHRVDEVLGPMNESWNRWLALEKRLTVREWDRTRPFQLSEALAVEELPRSQLHTDLGKEALRLAQEQVERGSLYRGDISSALVGLEDEARSDTDTPALAEVEMVGRWYSRGRYRAMAWQHHASCVQADRPWLEPISPLQALYREVLNKPQGERVPLPEGVITSLGDMDADQFRSFVFDHRRDLSTWWEGGDVQALRRTADDLAGQVPLEPARRGGLGIAELIGTAGTVGGATAGTLLGGPVGAAVGALVGSAGGLAAGRLNAADSARVRVRDRILEAWTYRTAEHVRPSRG